MKSHAPPLATHMGAWLITPPRFILAMLLMLSMSHAIDVTACGTLGTANTYYTLTADINGSASPGTVCIYITEYNITLDCNGHKITGKNASGSYGFVQTNYNGTIKNCIISNFSSGGDFDGTATDWNEGDTNILLNTTITTTRNGGYGLNLDSSQYPQIINSSITSAGLGIDYESPIGVSIQNSNITSTKDSALFFNSDRNSIINLCRITGKNNEYGALMIYGGSDSATITNSTIDGSGGTFAATLTGTTINGIFINNTFQNAAHALYLDSIAENNLFYWNNFTNISGYYITDEAGDNTYNTTINGKGEGNIWENVMNGSVNITGTQASTGFPNLNIGTGGAGYPYNETHSLGKLLGNIVDYAPLIPQPAPAPTSTTPASVGDMFNGTLKTTSNVWAGVQSFNFTPSAVSTKYFCQVAVQAVGNMPSGTITGGWRILINGVQVDEVNRTFATDGETAKVVMIAPIFNASNSAAVNVSVQHRLITTTGSRAIGTQQSNTVCFGQKDINSGLTVDYNESGTINGTLSSATYVSLKNISFAMTYAGYPTLFYDLNEIKTTSANVSYYINITAGNGSIIQCSTVTRYTADGFSASTGGYCTTPYAFPIGTANITLYALTNAGSVVYDGEIEVANIKPLLATNINSTNLAGKTVSSATLTQVANITVEITLANSSIFAGATLSDYANTGGVVSHWVLDIRNSTGQIPDMVLPAEYPSTRTFSSANQIANMVKQRLFRNLAAGNYTIKLNGSVTSGTLTVTDGTLVAFKTGYLPTTDFPLTPVFYTPTNTTYYTGSGIMTINYSNATNPNGAPIASTNLSLLNADGSFNKTLIGDNGGNLTYAWNISLIADGGYIIGIRVTDTLGNFKNTTSETFSLITCSITNQAYSANQTPDGLIIHRSTNPTWFLQMFNYTSNCPVTVNAYVWTKNGSVASNYSDTDIRTANNTGVPADAEIFTNVSFISLGTSYYWTATRSYYMILDDNFAQDDAQSAIFITLSILAIIFSYMHFNTINQSWKAIWFFFALMMVWGCLMALEWFGNQAGDTQTSTIGFYLFIIFTGIVFFAFVYFVWTLVIGWIIYLLQQFRKAIK